MNVTAYCWACVESAAAARAGLGLHMSPAPGHPGKWRTRKLKGRGMNFLHLSGSMVALASLAKHRFLSIFLNFVAQRCSVLAVASCHHPRLGL